MRRAIGAMLKRAGHTVTVAETGGQAVSLLKQRRIDVVVTDMLMPDIDGFDILFQVKEMSKRRPAIAISGGGRRRVGGNGAAHCADQRRCLPREAVRRICSSSSTSCSARRGDIGDAATERRRTRSRPHRASSPNFRAQETAGKVSREAAQQAAMAAIRALRYGDNDYFWINDLDAQVIMHPIKP